MRYRLPGVLHCLHAVVMFLQRFEMSDAVLLRPHESVQDVAFHKRGIAGKPNHLAVLIDRRPRVPPLCAKVADVTLPFSQSTACLAGNTTNLD